MGAGCDSYQFRFNEIESFKIEFRRNEYTSTISQTLGMRLYTRQSAFFIDRISSTTDDFAQIQEFIIERVDPKLLAGINPALWFDMATDHESKGNWHAAFGCYKRAAILLQGQQDGEYEENCIRRLAEKMSLGEASSTR